jgi:hypothetical protein
VEPLLLRSRKRRSSRHASTTSAFRSPICLGPSRFYQKIFGLTILGEDKPNEIVRMGTTRVIVSLHHKPPMGIMDHYAIAIEGFDQEAVTRALKQQGLTAEQNLDYGFYVRDPKGFPFKS